MTTTTIYAAVAQDHGLDAGVICYAYTATAAAVLGAAHSFAPIHVVATPDVPVALATVLTATVPPPRIV